MGPVIGFVTGMGAEARLLAGHPVAVAERDAEAAARYLLAQGVTTLVSFGLAGGLDPELPPGTLVVSEEGWAYRLRARHAPVAGSDLPLCTPAAKAHLRSATGAAAVDMETHRVAAVAAEAGVAFVAIRAVADPAHRAVPISAVKAWQGQTWPMLIAMGQWPALMRLAFDTRAAMTSLRKAARRL